MKFSSTLPERSEQKKRIILKNDASFVVGKIQEIYPLNTTPRYEQKGNHYTWLQLRQPM